MNHAAEVERRSELKWLTDDLATAACVLWASGRFSTFDISQLLCVPKNAVDRTLRLARHDAKRKAANA